MDRQQQIERFLQQAHALALVRLREHPSRLSEARSLLRRWRDQSGSTRSDPYWDEWEDLLRQSADVIESRVCAAGDHAAALRSVSPLSVLITQKERQQLLHEARRSA